MTLPGDPPPPIRCAAYWTRTRDYEHFNYQPTPEEPDPGPEGMIGMVFELSAGPVELTHYVGIRAGRRTFKGALVAP